jgi:meiotically up-regulated gene 157 (Mug157) protein
VSGRYFCSSYLFFFFTLAGLTSTEEKEKVELLKMLLATDAGTGHMHESYDADNPNSFTRSWFCWADALFAEFLLSLTPERCYGEMPSLEGLR